MDFDELEETEQARCEEDFGLELQRHAEEEERRRQEEEDRFKWEMEVEVTASLRMEQASHEVGNTLGVLFVVEQRDASAPKKRTSVFFCDAVNQALKKLRGLFASASGLAALEERVDLVLWFLNFAVQWHFRPAAAKHFERVANLFQSDRGLCGLLSELLAKGEHRHKALRLRIESVVGSLIECLWRLAENVVAGSEEDQGMFNAFLERAAGVLGALGAQSAAAPLGAEGQPGEGEADAGAGAGALMSADAELAQEVARWRTKFGKILKTSARAATQVLHELRGRFTRDGFQERYQDLRSRAKVGDAAHMQLLNMTWSEQSEVLPNHGYPATPAGLMEMRLEVSFIGTNHLFEVPTAEQLQEWDYLQFDLVVWKIRRDIHLVLDMGQPLPKMLVTQEMIEKRRREEENEKRLRMRPVSRHFHATELSPTLAYYAQGDHRGWGRGYDHFVRILDDLRDEMPKEVVVEARRGCMRIINMPEAEARREFMQVKCVALLQERLPWLDVDFVPGVRSGDLAWRAAPQDGGSLACPCGGSVDVEASCGPPCCSCKLPLEREVPFFSCLKCGGINCQDCSSGCHCGGQVAPLGSGSCWPCSACGAKLQHAAYYTCQDCTRFLCACCAGQGRAEAEWRGKVMAIDSELWGPPGPEEAAEMRARWERDAELGPDAFKNSFKYYNEGCDFTKRMSHGFVGSHFAHYDCWRRAADAVAESGGSMHEDLEVLGSKGPEWLLVVEDDAVPLPEFEVDWGDVLILLCREIAALRRSRTPWDLIWVGRSAAMGPEPQVWPQDLDGESPSLLVRPGYCILIHCYCLSRRGIQRLLDAPLSRTVLRPLDEVFGALNLHGRHLRKRFGEKIRKLGRGTELLSDFRCFAFPFRGIVVQMEDTDEYGDSDLATSHQARPQAMTS